jgi:hypothetical protein
VAVSAVNNERALRFGGSAVKSQLATSSSRSVVGIAGKGPSRLLLFVRNRASFVNLSNAGSVPSSSLNEKRNSSKLIKLPTSDGTVPASDNKDKVSSFNAVRRPICVGIVVKVWLKRISSVKRVNAGREGP